MDQSKEYNPTSELVRVLQNFPLDSTAIPEIDVIKLHCTAPLRRIHDNRSFRLQNYLLGTSNESAKNQARYHMCHFRPIYGVYFELSSPGGDSWER